MSRPRVAVLGAGCVGAWMGGMLARAGWAVTLIGRSGLCDSVRAGGLEVAALGERPVAAPVIVTTRPEGAAGADVLIVSVKGRDTRRAAEGVRRRLRADTVVMSFQNGLRNPARLRAVLPAHRVVPGMVSFNVAWETVPTGGARFRQLTSGPVALEDGAASPIVGALRSVGVAVSTVTDMQPVQWTKLVLNLNNAVNALSGLPLAEQLSHRGYRRILADAMDEAWTVMDAAGIRSL
ncbi:MAG: 2-dehydropantoate 2-reductase, partial [Myxococcota bacterium]|nr:2-dehydropantoate 2-reductase [Myxococcota bacterium]